MANKFAFCLWNNGKTQEMADFYLDIFEQAQQTQISHVLSDLHGTPGDILTITLELAGSEFLLLNGGSEFTPTPAVSYIIQCPDETQTREVWHKLSTNGEQLMPLENTEELGLFGWTNDQFGISWQVVYKPELSEQSILPCLLFANELAGKVEYAVDTWIQIFTHGEVLQKEVHEDGSLNMLLFKLYDQEFLIIDSKIPHEFSFSLANSFYVYCEGQPEIDRLFYALEKKGTPLPCGWITDEFGVAWQLVTRTIDQLFDDRHPEKSYQATLALFEMTKIDIGKLQRVYDQG